MPFVFAGIAGCGLACAGGGPTSPPPPPPPPPVASVTVTPENPSVAAGATAQLTATTRDAQGNVLSGRPITWNSLNEAVATVSSTGLVTGVAPGSADVRATSEGRSGTTTVTVTPVPVETVTLAPALTLEAGESGQLTATLKDAQGNTLAGRPVVWNSQHPQIASVSQTGLVAAIAVGAATITATSEGKVGQIVVDVVPIAAFQLAEISVGGSHACGLKATGEAWCWGQNSNGEVGDGSFTLRSKPVRVSGSTTFTAISAGGIHSCALTAAGEAWCWGDNLYGSLGDGTFIDSQTPIRVAGGHVFASITTGAFHTCARTAAGVAWCWGYGDNGALGDNGAFHRSSPVLVVGGHSFAQLSAGYYHTCGVLQSGAAYCWGDNGAQALGGVTTAIGILGVGSGAGLVGQPVAVTGGVQFAEVAAGLGFTCGRTAAGALHCWGVNTHGNLGIGNNTIQTAPAALNPGVTYASIMAAAFHACARSTTNAASCWGRNSLGQLGDGTNASRTTPGPVAGGLTFTRLRGNASTTCAVSAAGEAWCWGNGGTGAIGDGTTQNRNAPVRVKP